jgi:hypothetical protein
LLFHRRSPNPSTGLLLSLLALALVSGCKSNGVEAAGTGSAADISPGPPTWNAQFQTRNPRVCAKVTHVPNTAEATVMVQCDSESGSNAGGSSPVFLLTTNLVVEMGAPKPYNAGIDSYWQDIDPSAKVYPLRGSSTGYACSPSEPGSPGHNCIRYYGGGMTGQGRCWHTQFNEWRCSMTTGGSSKELNTNGPSTF